jgi:hypothetical protein
MIEHSIFFSPRSLLLLTGSFSTLPFQQLLTNTLAGSLSTTGTLTGSLSTLPFQQLLTGTLPFQLLLRT